MDDQDGESGHVAGGWSLTFTTAGGTDYVATSGTVSVAPGTTSGSITVPVIGDTTIEPTETFVVNPSNASNASIVDAQGIGTIVNDDAAPFIDPTLTIGQTAVKLVHITELRTRISALRAAGGLGAYSWTDPSPVAGTTAVRAVHILELRAALADAYVAAGLPAPSYSAPVPAAGVLVKVVAISELRAGVIALELL